MLISNFQFMQGKMQIISQIELFMNQANYAVYVHCKFALSIRKDFFMSCDDYTRKWVYI